MIEVEEEIICVFEEIDIFSSINRTLRDIKASVERMGEGNRWIVQNLNPYG